MREIIDIRLPEEWATKILGSTGERIGELTRRIVVEKNDPVYQRLRSLLGQFEEKNLIGFSATIRRQYTQAELDSSELLRLMPLRKIEPAGEECGTKYDDSVACSICGAGRVQETDLILDLRKIPKSSDIARTIAYEWVVSQRFAALLVEKQISGVELQHVHHKARYEDEPFDLSIVPSGQELLKVAEADGFPYPTWQFWVWLNRPEQAHLVERATNEYANMRRHDAQRKGKAYPIWYQLKVISNPVTILSPPTQFGINPFNEDRDGSYRCPLGHVLGLNVLSELWIKPETWDGSDIMMTSEMIGVRRGLLIPEPLVLISARLYNLMKENNIKGYNVELVRGV
jgi:hypothetical protein